jgi:hypothetical protein
MILVNVTMEKADIEIRSAGARDLPMGGEGMAWEGTKKGLLSW